ncbi:hypothetical protein PCASD_15579 [Puccinia coronata f. sp. avenae]|uniref:Cation-transporting ATPase n=1 Tax=Puccinia coronata f. sp. avenae TaxID=200324 RepID=A0A2N5TW42_9BASI|nr:hypothetical protein PCASD_15579 [Puccinia coronata f. sp. avenae]
MDDSPSAGPSLDQDTLPISQQEETDEVDDFRFDDREQQPNLPDLPIYDDPTGSMFSGPVAEVTPSSVTNMHLDTRFDSRSCRSTRSPGEGTSIRESRPPNHRRKPSVSSRSIRSHAPSKSSRSRRAQDDRKSEAGVSVTSSRRHTTLSKTKTQDSTRLSPTEEPESGFFNNLSAFLKGKGRSRSRDSRASSSRDNYHYHSVNDKRRRQSLSRSIRSAKSSTWRSLKSARSKSRKTPNEGLNDHRIEVIPLTHPISNSQGHSWHPTDHEMTKAQRLSTQSVYIIEDDLQIQFFGWKSVGWKVTLWWIGCVMSTGILWLVGRWKVAWRLKMGILKPFNLASHIVAYTEYGQPDIIDLQILTFSQPIKLSTLCPPSLRVPPTSKDDPLIPINSDATTKSPSPIPTEPASEPPVNRPLSELLLTEIHYIDFRYHRFLLHPITQAFMRARDWQDPAWSKSVANLAVGLDHQESLHRTQLFGNNIIEVAGKSTSQLLMDEVLHPFYIFQIASIILWSVDDYYYYAFCIALISVISVLSALMDMKRNLARMRELSRFTCEVKLLRGAVVGLAAVSTELVPGDVIDVSETSLHTFPADLLLLSGDAIVNESMLTGESVPVSKFALPSSNLNLMASLSGDPSPALAKHILFCGTNIIRVRKANQLARSKGSVPENAALAMVVRTGFSTTKGALVRSMLFPKPMDFAFYRDSFRFIGALTLIASFGFVGSSINFLRMGIDWRTIMVRALDLITIVVPPALPATMSIGTSFAMSRLRKKKIFCISPNRVNMGGKINLVCFDKTGTLTEEGLDILGVRTVDRSDGNFSELYDEIDNVPVVGAEDLKTPLVHALATCHGLKAVNGQIIGDPLDLRMFQFTGWSMEEAGDSLGPSNTPDESQTLLPSQPHKTPKMIERQAALVQTIVRPPGGSTFEVEDALKSTRFLELGIIRTFDFASELRRMSVLVKKLKSSTIEAYVKGAPEAMVGICMKETLPADYEEFLNYYTRHGYRVIAVAAKSFPKLSWIKAQRLTRSQVESELRFIGFVIFENKLKLATEPAIQLLKSAHIGVRMCTGDNIRTAISVGRDCGMIEDSMRVYLPTFTSEGSSTLADSTIAWFDIDNESALLDPYSLMPLPIQNDESDTRSMDSHVTSIRSEDYVLAVSGDVFRWIMDYGSLETIERMLYKGVIFARMSPDEKHELVEQLQGLDYTVGFCGDGANDCGALKAANVGLSLSEAEASVAAPFTSRQPEITCFIDLIREGRCALVTSFSCFKYMALYSLIQFTTITLLYSLPSSLGDFQFLYIDLFIIIPVAVTMGRTHPYGRIVAKRPTANLVSKRVLTSLVGQILINSTVQLLVFLRVASQHEPVQVPANGEKLPTTNQENSALFLVSIFQYILVAATFSVGPPYRKPIFSNYLLVLCLLILGGFSLNLLFLDSGFLFNLLELVPLDYALRLELLLWISFNIFSSWLFENYATQPIALWVGGQSKSLRKQWNVVFGCDGSSKRDRKRYKIIADSMETF